MKETALLLRTMGDETRLRLLRLLAESSLNVTELTTILGMAQSGVSKNVGLLRKAGLLKERREGLKTFYRLCQKGEVSPENRDLWGFLTGLLEEMEDDHHDLVRLAEVLAGRGGQAPGLHEQLIEPGESWHAWSRVVMGLMPSLDRAVDLGCGSGVLSAELARLCREVVGVDVSPKALSAARAHVDRMGLSNVRFVEANMDALDIAPGSCDLALLSQTLHHLPDPMVGIETAARLLKPEGSLILMELLPHKEAWVKEKLGHLHLGFSAMELEAMLGRAGLQIRALETLPPSRGERFRTVLGLARALG